MGEEVGKEEKGGEELNKTQSKTRHIRMKEDTLDHYLYDPYQI